MISCLPDAIRCIFYALFYSYCLLKGRNLQNTFIFDAADFWSILYCLYEYITNIISLIELMHEELANYSTQICIRERKGC